MAVPYDDALDPEVQRPVPGGDRRGDHVAGLEVGGVAFLAGEEHPPLERRRQQVPQLLDDRRRRLQGGPAGRAGEEQVTRVQRPAPQRTSQPDRDRLARPPLAVLCGQQAVVTTLAAAVARRWTEVVSNAKDPEARLRRLLASPAPDRAASRRPRPAVPGPTARGAGRLHRHAPRLTVASTMRQPRDRAGRRRPSASIERVQAVAERRVGLR